VWVYDIGIQQGSVGGTVPHNVRQSFPEEVLLLW